MNVLSIFEKYNGHKSLHLDVLYNSWFLLSSSGRLIAEKKFLNIRMSGKVVSMTDTSKPNNIDI